MNRDAQYLINQRDGLLREMEYLEKRLNQISQKIMFLNAQIPPSFPARYAAEQANAPNAS